MESVIAGLMRATRFLPEGRCCTEVPAGFREGLKPLPASVWQCRGKQSSLGGHALALPCSRPVVLSHPPLLQEQAGFQRSPERWRRCPFITVVLQPVDKGIKPLDMQTGDFADYVKSRCVNWSSQSNTFKTKLLLLSGSRRWMFGVLWFQLLISEKVQTCGAANFETWQHMNAAPLPTRLPQLSDVKWRSLLEVNSTRS